MMQQLAATTPDIATGQTATTGQTDSHDKGKQFSELLNQRQPANTKQNSGTHNTQHADARNDVHHTKQSDKPGDNTHSASDRQPSDNKTDNSIGDQGQKGASDKGQKTESAAAQPQSKHSGKTDTKGTDEATAPSDNKVSQDKVSGNNTPEKTTDPLTAKQIAAEKAHLGWLALLEQMRNQAASTKNADNTTGKQDSATAPVPTGDVLAALISKLFGSDSSKTVKTGKDSSTEDVSNAHKDSKKADSADGQASPLQQLLAMLQQDGSLTDMLKQLQQQSGDSNGLKKLLAGLSQLKNSIDNHQKTDSSGNGENMLTLLTSLNTLLTQLGEQAEPAKSGAGQVVAGAKQPQTMAELMAMLSSLQGNHGQDNKKVSQDQPAIPANDVNDKGSIALDINKLLQNSDSKNQQQLSALTDQALSGLPDSTKQNFVAALQAGLSEMREQQKQGKESKGEIKSALQNLVNELGKLAAVPATSQPAGPVSDGSQQHDHGHLLAAVQPGHSSTQLNSQSHQTNGQTLANTVNNNPVDKLVANLHSAEGAKALVDKVQMMINQRELVADIRVDPPDLGKMQIRVHMGSDATSVNFVVQSQHAKDTLEQQTPRLKELLAERGIELGQSNVQQDNQGQGGQLANQQGESGHGGGLESIEEQDDMLEKGQQPVHWQVKNGAINGIDYFV